MAITSAVDRTFSVLTRWKSIMHTHETNKKLKTSVFTQPLNTLTESKYWKVKLARPNYNYKHSIGKTFNDICIDKFNLLYE